MSMGTETTEGKDKLPAELGSGTPSSKKASETSKDKGKLFTAEQITKIISDAKAEEGRKWKPIELERDQLKTEVGNLTNRVGEIEQANRAKAQEEARESQDPKVLVLFNRETEVADRERKAQAREDATTRGEAQLKADREAFETETGATMLTVIAQKYNLEPSRLEALGITDRVALDKVASEIATAGKPPETEEEKTERERVEAEGGTYQPASELPSGAKPVQLDVKSVEEGSMESLETKLAPPPK